MNNFFLLQKEKLVRLKKIFQGQNWPQILVILVLIFISILLMIATFFFSYQSFSLLKKFPAFLKPLSFYTLSTSFFLIFILTFLSSLISSFKTLFSLDDNNLLLPLPISFSQIFATRFLGNLFLSSWPVIIFGLPLLASFAAIFRLSVSQFLASFIALSLLLLIVNLFSCFISLLITYLFGNLGKKFLLGFLTIFIPLFSYLMVQILIPEKIKETFAQLEMVKIQDFFASLPIASRFLPSTWVVNAIFFIDQSTSFALLNFLWLLIFAAIFTVLVFDLARSYYFPALGKSLVVKFVAGPWDKTIKRPRQKFPYFLKGARGALWEKENLTIIRDQSAFLQGTFIIFLSFLYFFLLSKVPLANIKAVISDYSLETLTSFNFLASAYLLTIFSLRFAFPSFSLEGQSAWVIFTAPLKRERLFSEKIIFFWIILTILGLIFATVSGLIFKFSFFLILSQVLLFVPLSLGITAISLGLGCLLPNFSEQNLEKLSTSPGGVLTTALSLTYIGVVSFLTFTHSKQLFPFPYLFIWLISLGLFLIISFLVSKKINRLEP